jgi:hypothetical protein
MPRDTLLYYRGAQRLVSVTEALDLAGLVDWSWLPPDVLEKARDRGTRVHQWIARYHGTTGAPPAPDDDVQPYTDAYIAFTLSVGFKAVATEEALQHPTHGYAGTLDLLGCVGGAARGTGSWWLIDVKATASLMPEFALQTAAYAELVRVHYPKMRPLRRGVLHLGADRSWRLHEHHDTGDLHDFLACVRVAHYKMRHAGVSLEG